MLQKKILTNFWGELDLTELSVYLKIQGFKGLEQAFEKTPAQVVTEIIACGLQGRGGAGFPLGEKLKLVASQNSKKKYLVCNLEESEPGTFKDRTLVAKDPFRIIEGMLISAYSVGADEGLIYLNETFHFTQRALEKALDQAYQNNFLGNNILGTNFNFQIKIYKAGGAYITGEESAQLNSIEGFRGEPRLRPPLVCTQGLNLKPTVVSNAETLANLPWILLNGAIEYRKIGQPNSPGTKLFSIDGAVNYSGVFEAPIGTSISELIYQYAGGIQSGKELWFVQVGGSAGNLVPVEEIHKIPSYDKASSLPMGPGTLLVVDKRVDIKKMALSWITFFQRESCGKCVPCREGTFRLKHILQRSINGNFNENDRQDMEKLIWTLEHTSFCALGKYSVNALKDAIKYKFVSY